jgi:hypothetical protein
MSCRPLRHCEAPYDNPTAYARNVPRVVTILSYESDSFQKSQAAPRILNQPTVTGKELSIHHIPQWQTE